MGGQTPPGAIPSSALKGPVGSNSPKPYVVYGQRGFAARQTPDRWSSPPQLLHRRCRRDRIRLTAAPPLKDSASCTRSFFVECFVDQLIGPRILLPRNMVEY